MTVGIVEPTEPCESLQSRLTFTKNISTVALPSGADEQRVVR